MKLPPLHNGWRGTLLAGLGLAALFWPDAIALVLVTLGIALLREHLHAESTPTTLKERRDGPH